MKIIIYLSALFLLTAGCSRDESTTAPAEESTESQERIVEMPDRLSLQELRQEFSRSNLIFRDGQIIRQDDSLHSDSDEIRKLEIAQKAYSLAEGRLAVPEGAKVIVREEDGSNTAVIFENRLPPGTRGVSSVRLIIDPESGDLLGIRHG